VRAQDLTYWDAAARGSTLEPGRVHVQVGASSSDIRLEAAIIVGR
jgi:hypothetical protein